MGLFPNSPFAHPVSSFPVPVPPPNVDPDVGPFATVRINCAWLPYIRGALFQLGLQSTWQGSLADVNLAQDRANQLIGMFLGQNPGDCGVPELAVNNGVGCGCGDDDMGCCLRVENGQLQMFCCGVWTDVPGANFNGGGQPGAPQPQPAPAGGKQAYCFVLQADGRVLLPTLVNSGDTLFIASFGGATSDSDAPVVPDWRCATGLPYVLGACFGTFSYHGGKSPTVNSGSTTHL